MIQSIKSMISTIYHCFKSSGIVDDKIQKTNEKVQALSIKNLENLVKAIEEMKFAPDKVICLNKKGEFFTAKGIQAIYYRYLTQYRNPEIILYKIQNIIQNEIGNYGKKINELLKNNDLSKFNEQLSLLFSSIETCSEINPPYTTLLATDIKNQISSTFRYAIERRIDNSQFDKLDISHRFSQEEYAASKVLKELQGEGLCLSEEAILLLLSSPEIPFYLKVALEKANWELQGEYLEIERSNLDEFTKFKSEADKKIEEMKNKRDEINNVLLFFKEIGINIYSKPDRRKMHDKQFWTAERKKGFDKINATINNFKDFFPVVFLTGCETIRSFTPEDGRDQTQFKYPTFYSPGGKNFRC